MPVDIADEVSRGRPAVYARVQREVPPRQNTKVGATVGLISGCQDNQTSMDGEHNGAFTEQVLKVWNQGGFQGNYGNFHARVKARLPATQSPNLFTLGAAGEFLAQKPFSV